MWLSGDLCEHKHPDILRGGKKPAMRIHTTLVTAESVAAMATSLVRYVFGRLPDTNWKQFLITVEPPKTPVWETEKCGSEPLL